jgi:hypothetical protein
MFLSASLYAEEREWRFRVFLDDKEIGTHDYHLRLNENELRVLSQANFEYKLLFVKLFEYQHKNIETWTGDCLTGIESRTDANGELFAVRGTMDNGRFLLNGASGQEELPACNMTFAYWNPSFLRQDRLINVQNGEVLDVWVSEPVSDEIEVRGVTQSAVRYRLEAGDMNIELWYSESHEWLALETDARGGRRLRYVLI